MILPSVEFLNSLSQLSNVATVEDWDRHFAINARGTFLCYKYAAEQMIAQGRGGRILGACSVMGKRGTSVHFYIVISQAFMMTSSLTFCIIK